MNGKINLAGVKRDIGLMVQSLARNIHDHDRSESSVPKTIDFMLSEFPENEEDVKYNWQCFIVPDTGEEVRPGSFVEFVTGNPPRGLGTTIGKLEVWVRAELPERLPMLRDSKLGMLGDHGSNQHDEGRVNNISTIPNTSNPDYIISRLKRDNPELAEQVIYGKISANQAAIQSGIRKKYVSVRCDPEGFARKINQLFTIEEIEQLKNLIQ